MAKKPCELVGGGPIAGCHGLLPTAEAAVSELAEVFRLIEDEHRDRLPDNPSGACTH